MHGVKETLSNQAGTTRATTGLVRALAGVHSAGGPRDRHTTTRTRAIPHTRIASPIRDHTIRREGPCTKSVPAHRCPDGPGSPPRHGGNVRWGPHESQAAPRSSRALRKKRLQLRDAVLRVREEVRLDLLPGLDLLAQLEQLLQ